MSPWLFLALQWLASAAIGALAFHWGFRAGVARGRVDLEIETYEAYIARLKRDVDMGMPGDVLFHAAKLRTREVEDPPIEWTVSLRLNGFNH
jgi:hypothetical protein